MLRGSWQWWWQWRFKNNLTDIPCFFCSLCSLGGMHFRMITLKSTINKFPSILMCQKLLMIHSATITEYKPCSRHCTSSKEKSQKGKYMLKLIFQVALLYGNKCLPAFYYFLYCLQLAIMQEPLKWTEINYSGFYYVVSLNNEMGCLFLLESENYREFW